MKPGKPIGVFHDRGWIWTRNRTPGRDVYGEKLRVRQGKEYRQWNPHRSKLGALAKVAGDPPWPDAKRDVLYLGASSGTTVSHVSDMAAPGALLYAVEFSPRSIRDLLWNVEGRDNVVPILDDASAPANYAGFIDRPVGSVIQDVAQRHQVDIFLRNLSFAADDALGFLFVKARSIDVAKPVGEVYDVVRKRLREAGCKIVLEKDLAPFEADHRAFVVTGGPR